MKSEQGLHCFLKDLNHNSDVTGNHEIHRLDKTDVHANMGLCCSQMGKCKLSFTGSIINGKINRVYYMALKMKPETNGP